MFEESNSYNIYIYIYTHTHTHTQKGKVILLQAWCGPEGG